MKSFDLVAVEHDGVQHAHRVAAGVEIQPQRERHPARVCVSPCACLPSTLHHRAHRAALFERDLLDHALELLLREPRVIGGRGAILAQQHQLAVAQRLARRRARSR